MTDTLNTFPAAPPVSEGTDFDAQRELRRAAQRIVVLEARQKQLEKALREIADGQCDAKGALLLGSCKCCLHDRMIARAALDGVG